MPFVKVDIDQIIKENCEKDDGLKKAWEESREEYRLIGEMIALRKQQQMTQGELAEKIGSKQQVVSRIEKKENSPTLKTFCNILQVLGYELKIVKNEKA